MAALIVQSGKFKGRKIALPGHEILIGRGDDCFIRLVAADISRHHCSLTVTSRGLRVRDLGSQNGTLVNDIRLHGDALLYCGDILQIGPLSFECDGIPKKDPVDDEIAGWLCESDTSQSGTVKASDTTIVNASQFQVQPKPKFNSVKEEAADIIRRYREKIQSEQAQKQDPP